MTQFSRLYFLRAPISLAFKTSAGADCGDFAGPYGSGFNAQLEVGWDWTESLDKAALEVEFSKFVKKIDHRHLGLDAPELKITTPESLVRFCYQYFLNLQTPVKTVRFHRGEDIIYRFEN